MSVITESVEEAHKDPLVDVQRRLGYSTVPAHPGAELSQNRPSVTAGWWGYRERKRTLLSEESDKDRGGCHWLAARSTAVVAALRFHHG